MRTGTILGAFMRAVRSAVLLFVLLGASSAAMAQVRATLVAADRSVRPGGSVTAAIRLEHQPQWHTYWSYPGTGLPTSISWQLPAGWHAGDIQWPVPELIRNEAGEVTGHGYTDIIYLPLTLTAPRDLQVGASVELHARVEWLMCARDCVPGAADLSLPLQVSAGTAAPDAEVRSQLAKMAIPESLPSGWSLTVTRDSRATNLRVTGAAVPHSAHFFPADSFIQFDAQQMASATDDSLILALPIAADADSATAELAGVLAWTDANGTYRGVRVRSAFGAASSSLEGSRSPPQRSASATGRSAMLATLSLAFVGGLILNLMPCVFPIVGIKVLGFIEQAGRARRKIILHGVVYTLGVLMSFWLLAGVLAGLRAAGMQLGWGFQLQSAAFVFAITAVLLLVALNLSGVFEIGLRASGMGSQSLTHVGYRGSFFTGILATVVSTPCSAPLLAPALGAGLALPIASSFLVFTTIGIGLAAPYLLLAVAPRVLRALPRPGRWMLRFRQVMAFPLYASVAYFVWVLAGQTSEAALLRALMGLTAIAMAAWIYGESQAPGTTARGSRLGGAGALAVLLVAIQIGWPRAEAAGEVVWEPWSAEYVGRLRAAGRPVYVDFTARWCATCQANKRLVFSSAAVRRYFLEHRVATLRADWTNSDPRITAELARWRRAAVPFNLVYRSGDTEPRVLPELLTPGIVLDAFAAPESRVRIVGPGGA